MVIVGVLTLIGGIIVALIQSSRRENRADHAMVVHALDAVHKAVVNVDKKIERHLYWHAEKVDERTEQTDRGRGEPTGT